MVGLPPVFLTLATINYPPFKGTKAMGAELEHFIVAANSQVVVKSHCILTLTSVAVTGNHFFLNKISLCRSLNFQDWKASC